MAFEQTSSPHYSEFIHLSRYARWREEDKRRETWDETVQRLIDFWVNKYPKILEQPFEEGKTTTIAETLYKAIYNLEVMPSMRSLMTAGKALDRDNVAGYNCAFSTLQGRGKKLEIFNKEMIDLGFDEPIKIQLKTPITFDEIFYILLCGTGVGFSVERQYVNNLPTIGKKLNRSIYYRNNKNFPGIDKDELSTIDRKTNTIHVSDSKYGWASALRILIVELYNGNFDIKWNTDQVRPAGEILKTFGGRSSGPEPLEELFSYCVKVFRSAIGNKLTSVEVHGIVCKIASIVVVGGVRRSALISLSNLSDDRMRHAKSGDWWIATPEFSLANNSAVYTEKPDAETFIREWQALIESKSGERGIFNREAANKQAARNGRRKPYEHFGVNPCCVTGDTPILIDDFGYTNIENVINEKIRVWNGFEWSDTKPFYTGNQKVYTANFSDGTELTCTGNHKFILKGGDLIQLQDMKIGDSLEKMNLPVCSKGIHYNDIDMYSQGFYSGDGNRGLEVSWFYEPMFIKHWVPVNATTQQVLDWLAGYIDADGTVTKDKNSDGIQVACIDKVFLQQVRLMLTRLGVTCKVIKGRPSGKYLLPDGKGGEDFYNCKQIWRLLIGNIDTYKLLHLGLRTERLKFRNTPPQRDARSFVTLQSIEYFGEEDTYCFEEPIRHTGTFNGIVTGQSEIILRDQQFCNLTEAVVRKDDDFEDLLRKVKIATILGTLQATLTDFVYLNPEWEKNTKEEALLGVSLTGVMDHPLLSGQVDKAYEGAFSGRGIYPKEYQEKYGSLGIKDWLEDLKQEAIKTNKKYAKLLGINQAVAITCNKPSGTVSQLVDCASGIHARHSEYVLRSVRNDIKDPISKAMVDMGFYYEVDVTNPSNLVFYFPLKSPEGAVLRNNKTAVEQLDLWKIYQERWCEHKPSVTISVGDNEWMEVGAWVYKNFDILSGVSFLPRFDHVYKQAPYQELTKEEYEEWVEKSPKSVDWNILKQFEDRDETTGMGEFACTGGSCEI